MKKRKTANQTDTGANYLLNISDMFMGLLFLFIILLVYYASQTNITRQKLSNARETRASLLTDLKNNLENSNIKVEIDEANGVLRLSDGFVSFIQGNDHFESKSSQNNLRKLSNALSTVLPYYIGLRENEKGEKILHKVEAVFVEGHTDSLGTREKNWQLSVDRGIAAFKEILKSHPELENFKNHNGKALFSVSGYGEGRPLPNNNNLNRISYNRLNRRIDFRFIMQPPENLIIENKKLIILDEIN